MKWRDGVSDAQRLKLYRFCILVVALGALAVRAPRLTLRPMHTDEAVHADKFGTLLEDGTYKYEPTEFHGPTLNYFTLIPAYIGWTPKYTQITEVTLRIVPVIFGTILVLLMLLLVDSLGPAAVVAAVLTALSPALVFYSRYYIQEMLLVCFTFGLIVCGYRYAWMMRRGESGWQPQAQLGDGLPCERGGARDESPAIPKACGLEAATQRNFACPYGPFRSVVWMAAAGLCAGLMHATKETCIIAFGAMGLTLALMALASRARGRALMTGVKPLHLALGIVVALGVSALFYSSFLHHPEGVLDSYRTYATYFGRGAGEKTMHVHPWYYYLQMLVFVRYFHGPIWTEGWIVLLALAGLAAAISGRVGKVSDVRFVRFLALYTVVMTVVYSAVPYKTPWCLLSFLHGMILLAGIGAAALVAWARKPAQRAAVALLLVVAAGHLAFLTYRANFVYYADSRNPYVYAHPTLEIFTIVDRVKEYVGVRGLGQSDEMPIQVAAPGQDYWPLPWYFRAYHVGWYTDVPEKVEPLILVSDKLEQALTKRIYQDTPTENRRMYLYLFDAPGYMWFRPGVKMLGFVRRDLWDARAELQTDPAVLMKEIRGQRSPTTPNAVRGR